MTPFARRVVSSGRRRLRGGGRQRSARNLARAARDLRREGRPEDALALARQALERSPSTALARRELLRNSYLLAPTHAALVALRDDVRTLLDGGPEARDVALAIDHAIAEVRSGAAPSVVTEFVLELDEEFDLSLVQLTRYTTFLTDDGHAEATLDALRALADRGRHHALAPLARALLQHRDFDGAEEIHDRLAAGVDVDDLTATLLAVDVANARNDPETAIRLLDEIRPTFDRAHSIRLVNTWLSVGDHQAVVDHLRTTRSGIPPTQRQCLLFDSLWALGDEQAAREALAAVVDEERTTPMVVARLDHADPAEADRIRHELLVQSVGEGDTSLLEHVRLLFEADRPETIVEVVERARARGDRPGPSVRHQLGRALYCLRRFDEADAELADLAGTNQTWAAAKLRSRIALERGDFSGAEHQRRRLGRPQDAHDEVLYHSLLAQGRWPEAFSMEPLAAQWRALETVFGDRAERHPVDHVAHRFVIADAGPGDAIQDMSLIATVAERSDRLTVTCDPRLASVFQRSFPLVEFVPVPQIRQNVLGNQAPGTPPRARNGLFRLLTEDADAIARSADRVVLSRGLKGGVDASQPFRSEAYLQADPAAVEAVRGRLPDGARCGIVWRSEMRTMIRNIHYLDVDDAVRIADAVGAPMICLQHDVDDTERAALEVAGAAVFLDDLDLRNDFETLAALVSELDLVIGIGTTTTNLSSAVGTPTLMAQPTHFGTWLAQGPAGDHFWYDTCRVVAAEPPIDRPSLISAVNSAAIDVLGARP